jgi:hypothetical protein
MGDAGTEKVMLAARLSGAVSGGLLSRKQVLIITKKTEPLPNAR